MSNKLHTCLSTLLAIFVLYAPFSHAFELKAEHVNGIYQLAQAERSPAGQTQTLQIEYGEMNGQTVLVTASCPKCPAAGYRLLETESKELGRPIFFNSSGIYIIAYDENTFVSVMADAQLGKKVWQKLLYANIYNKQGTPGISLDTGKEFVLSESKRLMTGEGMAAITVTGGNGTYFPAARHTVGSQTYDQLDVVIYPKQKIILQGMQCRNCSTDTYNFQEELSQAIGKHVYEKGHMGRFLIEQDKGVLWWTNVQLGKEAWSSNSHFNVLAQDKTLTRKLTINSAMQADIDKTFKTYATKSKAAVTARIALQEQQNIANNTLPKKGLSDASLEADIFAAAKVWANSYQWQETLRYAYITSRDWTILRHPITGIQTGRRIQGIIVMDKTVMKKAAMDKAVMDKAVMDRSDNLCSYQTALFEQAYNDSSYQKAVMVGVVPGQHILDCSKI